MTADQLAVLLALYRGLQVAADAEGWRDDFASDLFHLKNLGLICLTGRRESPTTYQYGVTLRGSSVVQSALLLA